MTSKRLRWFAAGCSLVLAISGCGGAGGAGASGGNPTGGSGGSSGAICAKLEPLSCWSGDCEKYVAGTATQAATKGCKAQAQAAFDCIEGDTPFCEAGKAGVQYGSACQSAIDAYDVCLQGAGQCTQVGFIGACAVICDTLVWGAECSIKPGDSSWSCYCRVGPHVGTTFTLAAVDKCSESLSAEKCAP